MPMGGSSELATLPQYPSQGENIVANPAAPGGAPGSVSVGDLNKQHADYAGVYVDWARMSLLYEGGYLIKGAASNFLVRRPRELQEVYFARVERVSYHNVLGTCFGWYHAALFKNPPIIQINEVDENGVPKTNSSLPPAV